MKLWTYVLAGFLILNGCIPVLIGAGVLVGYGLSNDAAYGNIKAEYRALWDLCLEKMDSMEAEVLHADESKGVIKAKLMENDVTITINALNNSTQKLRVSARKFLLPKPQFAQKVFFKIIEELE